LIATTQPTTIQSSLGKKETIRLKLLITTYHITYRNNWRRQLARGAQDAAANEAVVPLARGGKPDGNGLNGVARLLEALCSTPGTREECGIA
jgi:hypothetical protein